MAPKPKPGPKATKGSEPQALVVKSEVAEATTAPEAPEADASSQPSQPSFRLAPANRVSGKRVNPKNTKATPKAKGGKTNKKKGKKGIKKTTTETKGTKTVKSQGNFSPCLICLQKPEDWWGHGIIG